jgi:hypothetical protein
MLSGRPTISSMSELLDSLKKPTEVKKEVCEPVVLKYKPYTDNEILRMKRMLKTGDPLFVYCDMFVKPIVDHNSRTLLPFQLQQLQDEGFICTRAGDAGIWVSLRTIPNEIKQAK